MLQFESHYLHQNCAAQDDLTAQFYIQETVQKTGLETERTKNRNKAAGCGFAKE